MGLARIVTGRAYVCRKLDFARARDPVLDHGTVANGLHEGGTTTRSPPAGQKTKAAPAMSNATAAPPT
jgi:hypothetical protein